MELVFIRHGFSEERKIYSPVGGCKFNRARR